MSMEQLHHNLALARKLADARQRIEKLETRLLRLAAAEAIYRAAHDVSGDGSREAGRAWDLMRRAGDDARAALAQRQPYHQEA